MSEVKFMISEAAKQLQVEAHVLRYWEEELGLHIDRTEMGHRYYTKDDIQLFRCIKKLKNEGILLRELKPLIPELTTLRRQKAVKKEPLKATSGTSPEQQPALSSEEIPGTIPTEMPEITPAVSPDSMPGNPPECPVRTTEPSPESAPVAAPETTPESAPAITPGTTPESAPDTAPETMPESVPAVSPEGDFGTTAAEVIEVTHLEQVRSLFGDVITEAITANNRTLERNISRRVTSNVCREIDLLFQVQEQQEEEHYRKLDCLIRQQQAHRRETAESAPLGALKKLFT